MKKGEKREGRKEKMNQIMEVTENIKDFRRMYLSARHQDICDDSCSTGNKLGKQWPWQEVSWMDSRGPGCSVRLQLEGFGLTWPRYDTIVSPDSRRMNLKERRLWMM